MSKINWKTQLDQAQIVKEFSSINGLDINKNGTELLVTSNSRISLYNINNLTNRKTFNSGGSVQVFGANFRKTDYRLFTSSTKEGKLNIYDINNNKALRTIGDAKTKHTRAVRHSMFYGVSNIVSFSDDKHIKLWDLALGSLINDIGYDESNNQTAHNDYIRCGYSASEHNLIVSGSYDHTVKLWDPRSNESLHKYDHGAQVECVTMKNSLVISVGDKLLKVYDLISGKLVFSLENIHSKSITSVFNYDNYLLTSSLDGHVKVFDTNFKMLHSLSYTPAQLMAVCANKKALIVGGNDGLINVRRLNERKQTTNQAAEEKLKAKRQKTDWNDFIDKSRYENETIVKRERKHKETQQFHKLLKEFKYSEVLNHALNFKDLNVSIELIQELMRRDGLRVALAGRDEENVKQIVNFIFKNVKRTKYTRVLIEMSIVFTEVYMPVINESLGYQSAFKKLAMMLKNEINLLENLKVLCSQMNMISNISL